MFVNIKSQMLYKQCDEVMKKSRLVASAIITIEVWDVDQSEKKIS